MDVRTDAEWTFVGLPDLSERASRPCSIQWQVYPTMQLNAAFTDQLKEPGSPRTPHLLHLPQRPAQPAAAQAAQEAGFPHAFNVADGFEGAVDAEGHRGVVAGWKAEDLPWRQRRWCRHRAAVCGAR